MRGAVLRREQVERGFFFAPPHDQFPGIQSHARAPEARGIPGLGEFERLRRGGGSRASVNIIIKMNEKSSKYLFYFLFCKNVKTAR